MNSPSTQINSSKSVLLIVYLNVILYATCFQIQRPLEPFLVDKLRAGNSGSNDEYARLQSFFSIVQMLGSLISGKFLDRFGPKGGFLISFGASGLSYWILSKSTSMNILYLSKVPTIFQAGFLCAQLAATLVTQDGSDRVQALGRLTVCYTIGSIAGPAIGGFLGASGDYYFGATLAVYGSILSMVLTLLMPNLEVSINSRENPKANSSERASSDINNDSSISHVFKLVWIFLVAKVVTSLANSTSATAMPLILKNIYGLNEQSLGMCMSAMSFVNAVVNAVFLGPIVKLLGENLSTVTQYCLVFMAILSFLQAFFGLPSIVSYSFSSGFCEYILCLFSLSIFQYILASALTGESTSRVEPHAKGTLLGMEHSLFAAARTFTPQVGVWLLDSGGIPAVSGACGLVFSFVLVIWLSFINRFTQKSTISTEERKEK